MRLVKSQTTNARSIIGNGLKHDTRTKITTLDGTVMMTPKGTSDERPTTGLDGYLRFNLDYGQLEFYWDGEWRFIGAGGGGGGSLVSQTLYSGFNSVDRLFGPLDAKDTTYFVQPATDRTIIFVEQLYQSPFVDYEIVSDPLDTDVGGEIPINEIVNGKTYYIVDPGNSNWTAVGSADNQALTEFVANYTISIQPTLDIVNPNSAATGDEFGYDIDMSSQYIIVGSPLEEDVPNAEVQAGAAYIYAYNGTLISKITNPRSFGTAAQDWFGYSVAIGANYCTIGSHKEDDAVSTGNQSGKAYLYSLAPLTGVPAYTLTNPDTVGDYEDHFGWAVAQTDTHLVVSAPLADDTGPSTPVGKAYLYDLADPTAAPIEFKNPVAYVDGGRRFGEAVAINDVYVFVSAPQQDSVYMYEISTGDLLGVIGNPNVDPTDNFGMSLDISDRYLGIGAPDTDSDTATQSGKAYVYDIKGPTPTEPKYTFSNPNIYIPEADDKFGYRIAISDNYAIISAHLEDDVGVTNTGRAYIFDMADGLLLENHVNPNAYNTGDNDSYGTALAASNTHMIIGAHNEDNTTASSAGAIYVSEVTGKGTGTGWAREKGAYIKFNKQLNQGPVLKTRDENGKVHIEFDFDVNNLTITALYNVEAEIAGMTIADKWTFARQFTLDGDVTGSVAVDGSTDVVINTQLEPHSHPYASVNGNVNNPFVGSLISASMGFIVGTDWTISYDGTSLAYYYQGTKVQEIQSDGTIPDIPTVLTDLGITDGTNGQVLTTDGAGNFTFVDNTTSLTDLGITDGTTNQVLTTDGAGNFTFQDAQAPIAIDDPSTYLNVNGSTSSFTIEAGHSAKSIFVFTTE